MTRLVDAILEGAYSSGKASALDLRYGGMNGYSPNLAQWGSNQSYVRRNLNSLLLEAPTGFQLLPKPEVWVGALKALIEVHPKSIEGFDAQLDVETGSEVAVGGAGEMMQDFTNITRARSKPSYVWVDKYGRPIQQFLEQWILNLIGDPESKVPNIATLASNRPGDLLADRYSATVLHYEPDPTHQTVLKAWLTTNMFPLSSGPNTGKREIASSMEGSELSIEFSGLSHYGEGVTQFAQSLLTKFNMTNANPNLRPAFVSKISEDVSAATRSGYKEGIETLGSTAVLRS
jgi:hypothetical protein